MSQLGIVNYLDPTDKGLSSLVGEIYAGGHVYLFHFEPQKMKLHVGDKIEFELDAEGIAQLKTSVSRTPVATCQTTPIGS